MFKQLMAVSISLQLIFSGPLLAQGIAPQAPDVNDVKILLEKPKVLVAGFDETALKVIGGGGAVYAISRLLSKNAKITEKLSSLTKLFQRDEKAAKEIMRELFAARSAEFRDLGIKEKVITFDKYSAYLKANLLEETSKELSARGRQIEEMKRAINVNEAQIASLQKDRVALGKAVQENNALKRRLVEMQNTYTALERNAENRRITVEAMRDVMNEVRVSATKAKGMKNIIAKQAVVSEHLADLAINMTKFHEAQLLSPTKANIALQAQFRTAIEKTVLELEAIQPINKTLAAKVKEALSSAKAVLQRTAYKGTTIAGIFVIAGLAALSFIPSEAQAAPISTSRVQMKRILNSAMQTNPDDFALTVIALADINKDLVADVIAESAVTGADFYTPLKAQINAMTSADNIAAAKLVTTYAVEEQRAISGASFNKNALIKNLQSAGGSESFNTPYNFGF